MAVCCPPKVDLEHTQNKAQFGRVVIAVSRDLTASGICERETDQSKVAKGLQMCGIGSGETFHWHSKQGEGLQTDTAV
jgi:hypothetical protein